jgi:hypothetical protein
MILVSFVVGLVIGWFALRALINLKMKRMLSSIVESESPKIINRVDIDIVKLKDRFYVYKREDNSFLVHGDNKQDLIDQLHNRWPDKAFMASPANLKEVGLK